MDDTGAWVAGIREPMLVADLIWPSLLSGRAAAQVAEGTAELSSISDTRL